MTYTIDMIRKPSDIFIMGMMLATAAMAGAGCSERNDEPAMTASGGDIEILAGIGSGYGSMAGSRADTGDGSLKPVVDCSMVFTYAIDDANAVINSAECRFDANGRGMVYPGGSKPLQWNDLKRSNRYQFLLDNVQEMSNTVSYTETNGKKILTEITPEWDETAVTRYSAGPETGIAQGNDIVWGITTVDKESQMLHFEMEHRMSRINVVIKELTTEQASQPIKVELTGIVLEPGSFNRLNGIVSLPAESDRKTGTVAFTPDGATADIDAEGLYTSPNIIVPPQSLSSDAKQRPRLRVTLGDKTYSAALPHAMFDHDETAAETLSFVRGRHLTLVVRLSSDDSDPDILFEPVMVHEWIDKGQWMVSGTKGSRTISTSRDLEYLIHLYNQQQQPFNSEWSLEQSIPYEITAYADGNIYELIQSADYEKFDYLLLCKWTFTIENDLTTDDKFNLELYQGQYPFDINFNGHTINGCSSVPQLMDVGIHNAEELRDCIELYNQLPVNGLSPEIEKQLLKYGTYVSDVTNLQINWTFNILEDIEALPDVKFSYAQHTQTRPITINYLGHTVGGSQDQADLIEPEPQKPGIYTIEQLNEVIAAYNNAWSDTGTATKVVEKYGGSIENGADGKPHIKLNIRGTIDEMPATLFNRYLHDNNFPLEITFDNGVTVGGSSNPEDLIYAKSGIYTIEQLNQVIDAYNNALIDKNHANIAIAVLNLYGADLSLWPFKLFIRGTIEEKPATLFSSTVNQTYPLDIIFDDGVTVGGSGNPNDLIGSI